MRSTRANRRCTSHLVRCCAISESYHAVLTDLSIVCAVKESGLDLAHQIGVSIATVTQGADEVAEKSHRYKNILIFGTVVNNVIFTFFLISAVYWWSKGTAMTGSKELQLGYSRYIP